MFVFARLLKLPGSLLVALIGMLVDVPLITAVALWKSPYLLFRGWKRLLEDLIGREGPFLEMVCVPFAGLAILLWPLGVVGAVVGAIIASFFLGLYGGVIVHQVWKFFPFFIIVLHTCLCFDCFWVLSKHMFVNIQEDSLRMGFSYIVSVVSLFDEYVNDLLYLREGSCLPRYIMSLRSLI